MLVSLLTLGCPEQLSGGYLYHCRLAELAGDHDAEVEFVPVRLWPDPFTLAHGDVLLVDSIAAWLVAPWAQRAANRRRPLAAILHQPPGGIDNSAARRRIQAVLDRNLYRRCGLLIAASESLREDLVAPPHGMISVTNVPKSVPKWHENGPRRVLRGPFCLVAGTRFELATSGL